MEYGIADRDMLTGMSGLDFMRAMLDGRLPRPTMARTMNAGLDSVSEGVVTFRGAPGEAHLNPMGGVHGGWYGTLLDSALGCAVMTIVPRGSVYTTLEYKVNLTRALRPGLEVLCRAEVTHPGRRTAVAQAEIRGAEDGKLYATGSTTCLIMEAG